MAGMDGIGGATRVTVQDPQGNGSQGSVPALEVKAEVPAIGGGFGAKDRYHSGPPAPPSPPHPTTYCTLPPPPPIDPKQEARDLVNPVLHSGGAERLESYRKFTKEVKFASTAALQEACKLLDELSHNIAWTCAFPILSYNRQVAQLLRRNIEEELATRDGSCPLCGKPLPAAGCCWEGWEKPARSSPGAPADPMDIPAAFQRVRLRRGLRVF